MNRRAFLKGAAAGAAVSTLDWLRFFRSFGVPGSKKELGIAEAHAQAASAEPRFLIYWFQEGGWDGYSMFNPVDTRNDANGTYASGALYPTPSWTDQIYRPKGYPTSPQNPPKTLGNITYGYLAEPGTSLFGDMAVVSSHYGNPFHSGGRWDYHYGKYSHSLSAYRATDERTVMQAFCEAYGLSYLLPHVSWHRWLSDGELSIDSYPEGTGYYEKLGPAYAHTVYGKTPDDLRNRLANLGNLTASARDARIRTFVDNLYSSFLADKNSETVKAFSSAVSLHNSLMDGTGMGSIVPSQLFTDTTLMSEFGVQSGDMLTSAQSVNGNPARSKESPNSNVQAMMAYELMTKGLSIGFFIENRDIRLFDTHRSRGSVLTNKGQSDQASMMTKNLWTPLKALVNRLKNTEYKTSGKSYFDYTTIVLCSEMGRTLQGDVGAILSSTDSDSTKYSKILDQDVCQHWKTSSFAVLGGTVKGNTQVGRVGNVSLSPIPIMPDGTLDPAFDPVTGLVKSGMSPSSSSFVTDPGHTYATALYLSGLDPDALRTAGKGRNTSPPLKFLAK